MATEVDISKMLHLSTAHVTEDTNTVLQDALDWDLWNVLIQLPVFAKRNYGFFIFIGSLQGVDESSEDWHGIPDDLKRCIHYALERECDWLCLDCDVEPIDDLTTYDW